MKDRFDEFYFSSVGCLDEYSQFCKAIKVVLILFHVQASVERGFNINKAMLLPNLMSRSLTSQRLVYNHMKAHNLSVEPVVITKKLRHILLKGHKTNKELIWQKEKKQESDHTWKRKWDAIIINIKELKPKKIALEKVEKKS